MRVLEPETMLYLQELARKGQQQQTLTIEERLPAFIQGPCVVDLVYSVEAKDNFYLINLSVTGDLNIVCQRCMEEFIFPYDNKTQVAVCATDERASLLMESYECIVAPTWKVEVKDLVVDELYLYAPQFHAHYDECGSGIKQFLQENNETL